MVIANGEQSVSCDPVTAVDEVKVGERVVVCRTNSNEYGAVRAVNVSTGALYKGLIGVEMDLPSKYE